MVTDADLAAGEAALKSYVESIDGWLEANLVPEYALEDGVNVVMARWDSVNHSGDNPDNVATLREQCGIDLFTDISNAGYGDKVTQQQCVDAAGTILDAVLAERGTS